MRQNQTKKNKQLTGFMGALTKREMLSMVLLLLKDVLQSQYIPYISPTSFQRRKVPIGWLEIYVYSSRTNCADKLSQRETNTKMEEQSDSLFPF